eukprot:gene51198-62606_t
MPEVLAQVDQPTKRVRDAPGVPTMLHGPSLTQTARASRPSVGAP